MNIALAHHWLVGMRGGEKVLEQFSHLFPRTPIYTLVANPDKLTPQLNSHPLIPSLLHYLPGGRRRYKAFLPLFPAAVGKLEPDSKFDFLLSSDAAVIKGLKLRRDVPHVCYCHSPPRYLWDLRETYLQQASGIGPWGRFAFRQAAPYVRAFDRAAAQRVDRFIANSRFVQERIRRCYGRDSTVIHPPVSIESFELTPQKEDFYLVVSELVPYKRVDLAVEACQRLGRCLVVIGGGSELKRLRQHAGPTTTFLGSQPFSILKHHYETCRALLFPGLEDFGIVPLEAQAAGKPVIGYGAGGLLETTVHGETGLHFAEQTPESLIEAICKFEAAESTFDPTVCRANAARFSPKRFRDEIKAYLADSYPTLFSGYSWPELAPA